MPSKEQREGESSEQSRASGGQSSSSVGGQSNSALVEQYSGEMTSVSKETINLPNPVTPDGRRTYYIDRHLDFVVRYSNNPAPPGYYMNYGDKYINRFSDETNDLLSQEGQEWLARARINLQVAIEKEVSHNPKGFDTLEKDDGAFQSFAMGTHANAYWFAGLQDLDLFDLAHIFASPDAKDLLALDGIKQAIDIGTRLLGVWGEGAVDYALGEGTTEEVANAMYEGYGVVGDGIDEVFGQGTTAALEDAALQLGVETQDLMEDAYYVASDVIEGGVGLIDGELGEGTVEGWLDSGREGAQDVITGVESAYDWAVDLYPW
jgi:hypothetical protein